MVHLKVTTTAERRGRGRPRDATIERRVLDEALAEVARAGLAHFSLAAVAERAGVARGTVYLRWPDRDELVFEALARQATPIHDPSTGDLRADLTELVRQWAAVLNDRTAVNVFVQLGAARATHGALLDRYRREVYQPAIRATESAVERAIGTGEARCDADPRVLARMLAGGIWYEASAGGGTSKAYEQSLVDHLFRTVTAV